MAAACGRPHLRPWASGPLALRRLLVAIMPRKDLGSCVGDHWFGRPSRGGGLQGETDTQFSDEPRQGYRHVVTDDPVDNERQQW